MTTKIPPTQPTPRETFIVRFWRESPASSVWRGQVQHVRTGEVVYLRSQGELSEYVQRLLKVAGAEPAAKLK